MVNWEVGILILLAGFISGVGSSAPIGPINLWIIQALLNNLRQAVRYFIFGVILIDVIFAALASFSYYGLMAQFEISRVMEIVGGLFLLIMGFVALRASLVPSANSSDSRSFRFAKNKWSALASGVILCGSNPGFLMFWIFIVGLLKEKLNPPANGFLLSYFLLGIALGDLLWFRLISWVTHKGIKRAGEYILKAIRVGVSLVFIVTGGLTLVLALLK